MLEIGVGDAYGSCFEMTDRGHTDRNNDLTYSNHPRKMRDRPEDYQPSLVPPGSYTDDTQMAIAVCEAMLDPNDPWTKESLADRFVDAFHRNQRRGYTPYFLHALMNSTSGSELLTKIGGKSTKSGAAMRAGPVGLYADTRDVVNRAARQASVTHDTWLGKNSAVGAALMTHYFYHDLGPKADLVQWLQDIYFADLIHSPDEFDVDGETVVPWTPGRRVRVHAWDCLEAAIYAIERHDSLSEILRQCVAWTGDVDTVAAIAMGPASLSKDIEQDLPADLLDNFENRRYGRDYLMRLDAAMFKAFPRSDDGRGRPDVRAPAGAVEPQQEGGEGEGVLGGEGEVGLEVTADFSEPLAGGAAEEAEGDHGQDEVYFADVPDAWHASPAPEEGPDSDPLQHEVRGRPGAEEVASSD